MSPYIPDSYPYQVKITKITLTEETVRFNAPVQMTKAEVEEYVRKHIVQLHGTLCPPKSYVIHMCYDHQSPVWQKNTR